MNGMTLKSPIKGISNPILELKTEPHIEILVSLTPSSPDLRFRQMLVMLSESGGGSNLVGEGLGEERASRPDEVLENKLTRWVAGSMSNTSVGLLSTQLVFSSSKCLVSSS
jgi:hypothetical protein